MDQVRDWDEYIQERENQSERFQYVNEQGKGQLDWEDFRYIVLHRLKNRDTKADILQAFKASRTCKSCLGVIFICSKIYQDVCLLT